MHQPGRTTTALVVEDDLPSRLLLTSFLEFCGFAVIAVSDGARAVEIAVTADICVAFMDWHLPVIDGLEATRRIRAHEEASGRETLPIIATSASAMDDDVRRCYEAGVTEVIVKPLDLVRVREALSRWCDPP